MYIFKTIREKLQKKKKKDRVKGQNIYFFTKIKMISDFCWKRVGGMGAEGVGVEVTYFLKITLGWVGKRGYGEGYSEVGQGKYFN